MLVNNMATYHTCSTYCLVVGRQCSGAWEEELDTCRVLSGQDCQHDFGDYTSDAICQCDQPAVV